jgi:hypothetical protein
LLLLWRHLALRVLRRTQVRKNRHIEIIPLSTGCLGACTYCKTKHARGVLGSYTLDAIVSRARQAVADPEVWHGRREMLGLTSRPAACSVARQAALPWHQWEHPSCSCCLCRCVRYGSALKTPAPGVRPLQILHLKVHMVTAPRCTVRERVNESFARCTSGRDIGSSLPALLTALVAVLPTDGRTILRVGMTNPVHGKPPGVMDCLNMQCSSCCDCMVEMHRRPSFWLLKARLFG